MALVTGQAEIDTEIEFKSDRNGQDNAIIEEQSYGHQNHA